MKIRSKIQAGPGGVVCEVCGPHIPVPPPIVPVLPVIPIARP
jgi:hypothetical protein